MATNVFPSRANIKLYNGYVAQANRSLRVLKKKRDALEIYIKQLEAKLAKLTSNIEKQMRDAFMELRRSNLNGTDFKSFMEHPGSGSAFVGITQFKVMGIPLQRLTLFAEPHQTVPLLGLAVDHTYLKSAQKKFAILLQDLVVLASLNAAIKAVKKALRDVATRVNAIEYIRIPKLLKTLAYMHSEMEEREREDFYRMKKMKKVLDRERQDMKKPENDLFERISVLIQTRYSGLSPFRQTQSRYSGQQQQLQQLQLQQQQEMPQHLLFEPPDSEMRDKAVSPDDEHFNNPVAFQPKMDMVPFSYATKCLCHQRRVKKHTNKNPVDKQVQTDP